jgi:5-dehydro-2-deoxygluconokinase
MRMELTHILNAVRHKVTIVRKVGPEGAYITPAGEDAIHVPGFPVAVLNTVGAGDAFASGLLYARTQGWDWYRSGRFANACGAIVVTRHGCSTAMPTRAEVEAFVAERGGL